MTTTIKELEDQFEKDLSIPDMNQSFIISADKHQKRSGLTLLIKCVILSRNYPYLLDEYFRTCENIAINDKTTALRIAAELSNLSSTDETVMFLIKNGAYFDGNLVNSITHGITLGWSTEDTLRILIESGANINEIRGGETILDILNKCLPGSKLIGELMLRNAAFNKSSKDNLNLLLERHDKQLFHRETYNSDSKQEENCERVKKKKISIVDSLCFFINLLNLSI